MSFFRWCDILFTLDGTGDDLTKPQGCTKLPIKIPDLATPALEEDFNNPIEVIQPETLEFGTNDEDMEIHIGDKEDGIWDSALVVQEEEDEDCDIGEQSVFPSADDDLGNITLDDNDAGESMETRDSQ